MHLLMDKFDKIYMEVAEVFSKASYAERKKVGSVIVKDRTIIGEGYNGTPTGTDNSCEDENGETKWSVLHAEANALTKVMKSNNSTVGATIYTTLSPCKDCSKLILQSGVKRLVYKEEYKDKTGIEFLKQNGIEVCQII